MGRKSIKHPTPNPEVIILSAEFRNGVINLVIKVINTTISRKYLGSFSLKNNRTIGVNINKSPAAFSSNSKFNRSNMYIDSIKSPINWKKNRNITVNNMISEFIFSKNLFDNFMVRIFVLRLYKCFNNVIFYLRLNPNYLKMKYVIRKKKFEKNKKKS